MRILVVEDDSDMADFISDGLTASGHVVMTELDAAAGLRRAQRENCDVLVIDRMLPDMDGADLVSQMRGLGMAEPILLLTSLGAIEDRVKGLGSGADDYLVKPFAMAELGARVEALGRRGKAGLSDTSSCGSLKIDRVRREVWREGRRIVLQPREYELLEQLMRQPDQVVSRAMLLEQVWHFHFDPQTNIVETHMSRLRQKLNADFASDPIQTVRGVGYRLRSDV
ncbi:DNA-binding response regulator (plasmid) [Novosphingobium sp. P6W]|nr:DNA-binding response regulator [Novosphingobium sp. P6W]KIS30399.1 XRE family transcriptional regulator [Novosphingobium sp. P6W]